MRYVQKCTQQQKWQKREHNGEFGKYGKNDNFAKIANMAKHKAMRGPIKVGDTGEFGKYGENDNFGTFANKAKHKAMRGPIKVGDTGKFGKYGENDNFATFVRWPTGATVAHCKTNTFRIKTLLSLCNFSCFPYKYKPVEIDLLSGNQPPP